MKRVSTADQSASPAKQLAAFIARFDPAVAKLVRAARSALRNDCPPPSNRSTTITTFSPLASAVPSVRLHRLLGGFCEGSRPLVLLRGHAARSQSDPPRQRKPESLRPSSMHRDSGRAGCGGPPSSGRGASQDAPPRDRARVHGHQVRVGQTAPSPSHLQLQGFTVAPRRPAQIQSHVTCYLKSPIRKYVVSWCQHPRATCRP